MFDDINNICFIDSETRRVPNPTIGDVTEVGAYRYAKQAFATMWTTACGTKPTELIALHDGFDERLTWDVDASDDLKRFYERAEKGEAWFAAWNMAFDRLIWNGPQSDFPELRIDMTIDIMAQAAASGLPTKLGSAAEYVGAAEKMKEGHDLIKIFEPPTGETPQSAPEKWDNFCRYGVRDTDALRDVYERTRPLTRTEWEEYWAFEAINERGIRLDRELCAAVSVWVDDAAVITNERINALTDGVVEKVTEVQRIMKWVAPILHPRPEAYQPLIDKPQIVADDGTIKREEKLSLARENLEQTLAYLDQCDDLTADEEAARQVLELRQYGGSNTPQKFRKALMAADEGKLKGQYVFNGAAQTGRGSSRGVQIHNLSRSHLGDQEEDAIVTLTEIDDERVAQRLEQTA